MIPTAINVGAAKSHSRPTSWTVTPDDRQQKIEIIDGVHVQDFGAVEAGETIACTAIFNATNWELVKGYWVDRTRVTVIDESGMVIANCRVVVKSYTRVDRFAKYVTATLEFWKV